MATSTGSEALDRMVERLGGTTDPKRRYEYVLWLAKKTGALPDRSTNRRHQSERLCVAGFRARHPR